MAIAEFSVFTSVSSFRCWVFRLRFEIAITLMVETTARTPMVTSTSIKESPEASEEEWRCPGRFIRNTITTII
jgi:hypothetical protein